MSVRGCESRPQHSPSPSSVQIQAGVTPRSLTCGPGPTCQRPCSNCRGSASGSPQLRPPRHVSGPRLPDPGVLQPQLLIVPFSHGRSRRALLTFPWIAVDWGFICTVSDFFFGEEALTCFTNYSFSHLGFLPSSSHQIQKFPKKKIPPKVPNSPWLDSCLLRIFLLHDGLLIYQHILSKIWDSTEPVCPSLSPSL
jgi:hypothetical protein